MKIMKTAGSFVLAVLLGLPLAASAQTDFEAGTIAFKNAEYRQALDAFMAAAEKGDSSPALTYNMAVTYFKLGRYDEAEDQFERLLGNAEWGDVASFNLGLVAEKQGARDKAADVYRQVQLYSESEKLRTLATARLEKIASKVSLPDEALPPRKPFAGMFYLASGRDDDAYALDQELLLDSAAGEDSFKEYLLWGEYYLAGESTDGWRLHGFVYGRQYDEFQSLDINAHSLGLSRHLQHSNWRSEIGFASTATELDGDELLQQNMLILQMGRPINNSWLSLSYAPSQNDGGELFAHLDGTQHLAEARWRFPGSSVDFDLLYRWESNERDDLLTADEFFSFSPVRQTLGFGVDWRASQSWEFSLAGDYRNSEYDGINRLIDSDGVFKEQQREADRLRWKLAAQWQISPALSFSGQYEITDNKENFQTYDYNKKEMIFSFEYTL